MIFGYLCGPPGAPLTTAVIEDELANIGVCGVTERVRRDDPQQLAMNFGDRSTVSAPARSRALAIAAGGDGGGGNLAFPFNFVNYFTHHGDPGSVN